MALSYTEEDVAKLKTVVLAARFCRRHGIDYGELQSAPEIQRLLLQKLKEAKDGTQRLKLQDRFKEITEGDAKKRRELGDVYKELLTFFNQKECKDDVKEDINQQVNNCCQQIMDNINRLEKEGTAILVAGETGAGKSSFLNLLIGKDILPVDHAVSATSTICELHNSEKKEAKVHFGKDHPEWEVRQHAIVELDSDSCNVQEELKKYASISAEGQGREKNYYELIEIKWPIPMLQGSVFLVDSPGVGESQAMNRKVMSYLPKAVAFIYIINSSINGGGLSENRVEVILKQVAGERAEEELNRFHAQLAIFIFNKWDEVPEDKKEDLKERNISKLKRYWPGLNAEKQVYYLSVEETRRFLRSEAGETEEYKRLLDGIYEFMQVGLKVCIQDHYRWLAMVHGRINVTVQTRVTSAYWNKEERKRRAAYIRNKLTNLQNNSDDIVKKLEVLLEDRSNVIVDQLILFLQEKQTIERLVKYCKEREIPDEEDMDKNKFICKDLIRDAMVAEVANWEEENKVFEKTKQTLYEKIRKKFARIDSELQEIERMMQGTDNVTSSSASNLLFEDVTDEGPLFSPAEKMVLGLTSPIWLPLALIASAIALPIMGGLAIRDRIVHERKLQNYKANKDKFIRAWTEQMVEGLRKDDVRTTIVATKLAVLSEYITKFKSIIPELIEANKKLMTKCENEIQETHAILQQFNPLLKKVQGSYGMLYWFKFRHLLQDEPDCIPESYIQGKWEEIGKGSFADVYAVTLKKGDNLYHLAAKVMKKPVSKDNAQELAQERENFLKLQSKYVLQYYGIILTRENKVVLLTELCRCTLASVVFNDKEKNPGRQEDKAKRLAAFRFIVDKALQITRGLISLHRKKYTHRDLKLDNILLTEEGVIKLSDLGLAKQDDEKIKVQGGTFLYLDPQILNKYPPTRGSDVYSFSMILWELWYGVRVYSDILESSTCPEGIPWSKLEVQICKNEKRPTIAMQGFIPPFDEWEKLLKACWCKVPRERKDVIEIWHDLKKMTTAGFLEEKFGPFVNDGMSFDHTDQHLQVIEDAPTLVDSVGSEVGPDVENSVKADVQVMEKVPYENILQGDDSDNSETDE